MDRQNLVVSLNAVREQLRSRIETRKAAPEDLQAGLEEIEVLWEELRSQSDALASERKRYADFFEHAPEAYFVTEPNGTIREVNRAACELFGRTQAELAGKPIGVLVHGDSLATFRAQLVAARGNPGSTATEWRCDLACATGRKAAKLQVRAIKVRHKNAHALCWLVRPD